MKETLQNILDLIDNHDSNCESTYDYDRRIIRRGNNYQIYGENSVELETLKDSNCILSLLPYDVYDALQSEFDYMRYNLEKLKDTFSDSKMSLNEKRKIFNNLLKKCVKILDLLSLI